MVVYIKVIKSSLSFVEVLKEDRKTFHFARRKNWDLSKKIFISNLEYISLFNVPYSDFTESDWELCISEIVYKKATIKKEFYKIIKKNEFLQKSCFPIFITKEEIKNYDNRWEYFNIVDIIKISQYYSPEKHYIKIEENKNGN